MVAAIRAQQQKEERLENAKEEAVRNLTRLQAQLGEDGQAQSRAAELARELAAAKDALAQSEAQVMQQAART